MFFFDYLFYRICKAYSNTSSTSPEATSAIIVAIMQCMSIMSILMLIEILRQEKSILSKTLTVLLFLMLTVINYLRYVYRDEHNYKVISEKYATEKFQSTKGYLVVAYIFFTTGVCLGLAIYEGSKNW
jgi:hypothetical protein